jgi:hypothetical protein
MTPIDIKKWTLRDFPLMHKYTQPVIEKEIIDWLYEHMGPGQAGPKLVNGYFDYTVAHYGNGWWMEQRIYPGYWSDGTYHNGCDYLIHFESDAHEVMFRLIWR